LLNPSATQPETAYSTFQSNNAGRLNVVYVGANDGFLHGFEAGSYNSTTSAVTTPGVGTNNDGAEVIAYMPAAVLSTIHNSGNSTLDFSSTTYGHNYYVDGTPGVGDLYYNSAWHSWLVGGLGAGGSSIYALDVTNPANFSEANAASLVIGEWSASSTSSLTNLGNTYGTPQIGRFHDGKWGFLFGNGYGSSGGVAGVYVAKVSSSGTVSFTYLSTPSSASGSNGIFNATGVDLDGDGIIDYIYAGDLHGNLWRFDVTGNTTAAWAAATPVLLFQTANGQPISTQVQVASVPNANGSQRLMVDFGTGEQIPASVNPNINTYATAQQALYGIWDGNMYSWNSNVLVSAANQYDSFPSVVGTTTITQPYTVLASTLEAQTSSNITGNDGTYNYRTVTTNPVCWADGTGTCSTYGTIGQYGWTFALPGSTTTTAPEQVVFNPVISQGVFVVNTYIASSLLQCTTANPTGWTIALDVGTGGAFTTSYFTNSANAIESGIQTGATGSPSFVAVGGKTYLVTNTSNVSSGSSSSGNAVAQEVAPTGTTGTRLNWTELR